MRRNSKNRESITRIVLLLLVCASTVRSASWLRESCYLRGNIREISIPGCVQFNLSTNACLGFCPSYAEPSPLKTQLINYKQRITSYGKCCNIMETEDVPVQVMCFDGIRELIFKSAKTCSCSHCVKF